MPPPSSGEGVHDAVVAAEVDLAVQDGRPAVDRAAVFLADELEVPYLCAALELDGPEVAVHGADVEGIAVDRRRGPAFGYAYAGAGDQEQGGDQEGEEQPGACHSQAGPPPPGFRLSPE